MCSYKQSTAEEDTSSLFIHFIPGTHRIQQAYDIQSNIPCVSTDTSLATHLVTVYISVCN